MIVQIPYYQFRNFADISILFSLDIQDLKKNIDENTPI